MKKTLMVTGICSLIFLGACNNNAAEPGIYEKSGNTVNVNNQRADIYNHNRNDITEDFGYVRHQKSQIMGDQMATEDFAVIDREKVADMIGKYSMAIPNVDDVSTLVTSEEVLIVYDTDSDNRNLTADQVKRTAMSVVPRWYHVYVSDDSSLRNTLESYATMDADNRKAEYAIDQLIKEMKKSPQGKNTTGDEDQTEGA